MSEISYTPTDSSVIGEMGVEHRVGCSRIAVGLRPSIKIDEFDERYCSMVFDRPTEEQFDASGRRGRNQRKYCQSNSLGVDIGIWNGLG